MSKKLIVFLVLAVSYFRDSECHLGRCWDRIAGGCPAKQGEFPSFVGLRLYDIDNKASSCSGVLISDQHVLTAHHCVYEKVKLEAAVTHHHSRDWELQNVPIYRGAQVCTDDELFKRDQMVYDVAVIRLDRPVELSEHVQPAYLPNKPLEKDQEALAIGLGLTYLIAEINPYGVKNLTEALSLNVLPVKEVSCGDHSHESRICFESSDSRYVGSACKGDSGGPILVKENEDEIVYGLTSYGTPEDGKLICEEGKKLMTKNFDVYGQKWLVESLLKKCSH